MLAAVVEWRRAGKLFEPLHERAVVVEAAVDRNQRDACRLFLERFHRVIHADLFHEAVGRHLQSLFEDSHEVAGRNSAEGGEFLDGDPLREVL